MSTHHADEDWTVVRHPKTNALKALIVAPEGLAQWEQALGHSLVEGAEITLATSEHAPRLLLRVKTIAPMADGSGRLFIELEQPIV